MNNIPQERAERASVGTYCASLVASYHRDDTRSRHSLSLVRDGSISYSFTS